MEDLAINIAYIMLCFLMFVAGATLGVPNELENGCIVYNNKVYCEEVNKVED